MGKIYFIILNYNTANETKECVGSIRQLDNVNLIKHIIIIDNASTDCSFIELTECFFEDEDVDLYRMNDNVGFSKGNNYGYEVVRKAGDADFCVICNSDIKFVQRDFLSHLKSEYERSRFYICGPDVYYGGRKDTYYKGHQSPLYPFEWNKQYINAYQSYYELLCKKIKREHFSRIKEIKTRIQWLGWMGIKGILVRTLYINYRKKRHENIPIHGSCIIVSKSFLESETMLFYPETKFYGEEWLLYLRSKRNGYKIVFTPKLLVHHLQGSATSSIKNSILFCYENYAIAAKTYLEQLGREGNHED